MCAFCRLKNVTHTCFSINKCIMSVQMNHEICITLLIDIVFPLAWNLVAAQNPYDAPASPDSSTGSMSSLSSHSSYQSTQSSNNMSINTSTYYVGTPSPALNDFKPFDLESWWGRRLFNNITKSL